MSANNGEMSPPAKRRRTDSDHSGVQRPQELGLMRQESVGSSFIGSASGIHFVQSVYQAVNQASPATPVSSQTPRQELVPGEEDQLLSSATDLDTSKLWKPSETTSSSSEVAFEDLVRWSQSYFDHWHPALPFLHGPDFLAYCEKISQHGTQEAARHLDAFQLAVVRSVLSTCLADRRQAGESVRPDQVPAILVFDSYENAINSIQAAIVVPPSNSSLQAVMSVQLFLVSMLRHNAASRIGGVIIRLLFQLGLHRCPCRYSAFSANERLLRKRLFWSVYCMERYLCQSLGTPVTLRDDDIDVCYLDDEQHASDDLEHGPMDARLTISNLISKHSKIKGHVLELCNKSINHRHTDSEEIARMNTKIARWTNDMESALESSATNSARAIDTHRLVLSILREETIISLNRPQLTAQRESAVYEGALQTCIASSRSIIRTLASHTKVANAAPLTWPSLTWATWMSAFIVLYAAVENELSVTVALSLIDQSVCVLDHLAMRESVWPNACAKVVRDLADRVRRGSSSGMASIGRQAGESHDQQLRAEDLLVGSAFGPLQRTDHGFRAGGSQPEEPHSQWLWQGSDGLDLFSSFDIPFWLGDDQYADLSTGF